MTPEILAALLASSPAAAVLSSWPRRPWAAWAVTAAALAGWGAAVAQTPPESRPLWAGIGGWILCGGLGAAVALRRDEAEYARLEEDGRQARERRAQLERTSMEARAQGSAAEGEQKEAMALYGMLKGLSEALSWDEARPRLESAVQQYLGLEEFALYASELKAPDELHPLVTRRLGGSVGASWDTLSRLIQERRLSLKAPHALETPERAVAAPIRESDELMGYFYARIPAGADPKVLLEKVASFTEEIAFAFRRVKLFQELERLSQIDGLTGVHRRGVLDARLKEEVVRARTFKTSFCLILLDIDHFKRLNDAYGHQFGDQVLRRIGEILKASVYETDFVARYGGEEFAVLLPRAEPAGVLRKAQAIRSAVETEAFTLAMETVRVTASLGIAHYPRDGATPDAVVRQADAALYRAKELGRNRVVDVTELSKKG